LFELIGLDLCKSLAEDDAMPLIFGHELLLKMLHDNAFKPFFLSHTTAGLLWDVMIIPTDDGVCGPLLLVVGGFHTK